MTKQTGQAKVMEEFVAKVQNIEIVFLEKAPRYFADIKGYSLNGPYLVIQLHDDTQFVYPMSLVESLELSVTSKE